MVALFNKRFRPVAEYVNKQRHLRSPLEASSQLQKNVIFVVGWYHLAGKIEIPT
jgi:hypothetical protein